MNITQVYKNHLNNLLEDGIDENEARQIADEALFDYVDQKISEMKEERNFGRD